MSDEEPVVEPAEVTPKELAGLMKRQYDKRTGNKGALSAQFFVDTASGVLDHYTLTPKPLAGRVVDVRSYEPKPKAQPGADTPYSPFSQFFTGGGQ